MTATAQFNRPIIVGIVYLAAIVRFLTSLARRKETKPALNQHGSYRKLLVKRRLVKVMPDILIRGMEMPPEKTERIVKEYLNGEFSARAGACILGVSHTTFLRWVKEVQHD